MEIKNILVPLDFSGCSKNALRIAIRIAKVANAKIHMVNAVHVHAPHPNFAGGSLVEGIIADYEAQVKQSYEELESEIIELQEVPHDADRFLSYLTDAIFAECKDKQIDLIVMGTRSDHDEIEHLIGTHATDVIESSDVPVLVIPEDCHEFNPTRIGFASDFLKVVDYGRLDILIWFATKYDAEVMVFHVADDPSKLSDKEQHQIDQIKKQLAKIDASIRTTTSSSAAEGIMSFVESHELDVLAMLPRKHTLFARIFKRSVTKSMAVDPKIPLLTFSDV